MPREDGTGPLGMGLMSGKGAGYCGGYTFNKPAFENCTNKGFGWSCGFGICGFGRGSRGWRHQFYATGLPGWVRGSATQGAYQTLDKDIEKKNLNNRVASLKAQIDQINKTIEHIEKASSTSASG